MSEMRNSIIDRMKVDLIGPTDINEIISDRPSDRYLTGILFPPRTMIGQDQDGDANTAENEDSGGTSGDAVSAANATRPSSAGLSFALRPGQEEDLAAITIKISCARYIAMDQDNKNPENSVFEVEYDKNGKKPNSQAKESKTLWQRLPLSAKLEEFPLDPEMTDNQDLTPYGIPGLWLHLRTSRWNDDILVTVVISNKNDLPKRARRTIIEEANFFQVNFTVEPTCGAIIIPKPVTADTREVANEEANVAALIYRNVAEYAVGHTCSAEWSLINGTGDKLMTSWIPQAFVHATSAEGDPVFSQIQSDSESRPLNAKWISEADDTTLIAGLERITGAYSNWIENRSAELKTLQPTLHCQGNIHITLCRKALDRMQKGIAMLQREETVRTAFRLANRALHLQHNWKEEHKEEGEIKELNWRPFQIAFALLTMTSVSDNTDDDREVMDLLWFPTGGGKTEAYLLIAAHTIFLRRLRADGSPDGAGVTIFMRYTLRLLTIQQFQRAASLICACELIRTGIAHPGLSAIPDFFRSDAPISLGLWVGEASTPNKVAGAIRALQDDLASSPKQLQFCPACNNTLEWKSSPAEDQIWACCNSNGCDLSKSANHLPIWTVDEDVYRELPSLLIGTVDKYAQIARKAETAFLFGIGVNRHAPELIIQDELHLISGPLGTLAGIYEIAVDELCSFNGKKPKIIGSTATIRRAEDQIHALFDRESFQFPPPGLDHTNSGFSMVDINAPGRIYVGLTTAGRSAKFALQAVSASLLQAACDPNFSDEERDPYWTLVAYFNSLRELGGAVVLMQDDVVKTLTDFASRRSEAPRNPEALIELTSRVQSSQIPELLDLLLKKVSTSSECVDITLASNMISVGVDIPRLGLMLVNGQPKGMAEYIQATSRVGRGTVPGLVVTIYNANKARDRSHYESFQNWHQSLYRDVEATSVTPFAPRARDRALHAAFVAMARHLIPGMNAEPVNAANHVSELQTLVDIIVARAERVDLEEASGVRKFLENKLSDWVYHGTIPKYWNDYNTKSLMISAETAAEFSATRRNVGQKWPTPNSLRSVEASVEFTLRPGLKDHQGSADK